jgi:LysR family hydrogen peroxide-inducible transcriptional activator
MKAITKGISLRSLGYLVTLAEERHFGRAAERCFVSQPTLSAQIKKLEEQLGGQLLERTQRRVMVTGLGREVVERARRILQGVDEIVALTESRQDPLAGELRVGLIPTVAPYLLPRVAGLLKQRLPRLRLMLLELQTEELLRQLSAGSLDLAILARPFADQGLESEDLYREDFFVALPGDHPLTKKQSISVADLDNQTVLLLAEGHCLRDQALEVCGRVSVKEPQDFRATSLETVRQMVAAGIGTTLLPALAIDEAGLPEASLAVRPFTDPRPNRVITAAWRATSAREATMRNVGQVIRDAVRGLGDGVNIV